MSKDSYWFKHDDSAGRGLKMRKMSHIYGHWGKGIYWDVVEILRSQDKYMFSSDESSLSLLSDLIGCKDESKFINWFNDCIRIGLFEIVDKSFFLCPPLTENMKVWEAKKDNGSKGGRPEGVKGEKTIFSISGKEILRHPVSHCAYLIYDKKLKQHKIGETSNLFKRRLSIKRPTSNIDIIDFVDLDKETCFEIETEVKKQFSDKNISGDWFYLNEEDVNKIIMIFNKKTKGKKYLNNTESLPNQKHKIIEDKRIEDNVKEKYTHEQKLDWFKQQVKETKIFNSGKYPDKMFIHFTEYWTAKKPNGTKMAYEMQKTFSFQARLMTWVNNDNEYKKL